MSFWDPKTQYLVEDEILRNFSNPTEDEILDEHYFVLFTSLLMMCSTVALWIVLIFQGEGKKS